MTIRKMSGKRFSINDYIVWGFLALTVLFLGLSISVSDSRGNTDRVASKVSKVINKRMKSLDRYANRALAMDKDEWMSGLDLPEDMVVYRYIEDSLQSWCNQFPVFNDDISSRVIFQRFSRPMSGLTSPLSEVGPEPKYVNFGQKWYLVKADVLGVRKTISGLEIINSSDGSTTSQGVNKRFRLSRAYYIVPLSEDGGSVVTLDGKPVFKVMDDSINGKSIVAHSMLTWLSLVFFIIASLLFLRGNRDLKHLLVVLAALFAAISAAYFWGRNIQDSSMLFSPTVYADGQFFNSLGTVLIVSLFIFLGIWCLYLIRRDVYRRIIRSRNRKSAYALTAVLIAVILIGLIVYTHLVLRSIILNSNISMELYKLNELSPYSLIVYAVVVALLLTAPLLLNLLFAMLRHLFGLDWRISSLGGRMAFAILAAGYLVITCAVLGFQKEKDRVNVWANRLSMDRHISLELVLREQEEMISSDQIIAALSFIDNSNYIILNRIVENYLVRFSQNYDMSVEIFPEKSSDPRAIGYFTNMMSSGTAISEGSRFRYVRDASGHSVYVGGFIYYSRSEGISMMLLTVSPKSNRGDKGYASILGYSAPGEVILPSSYSYAKYSSGSLTSYNGIYAYPTVMDESLRKEVDNPSSSGYTILGNYIHFFNKISDEDIIFISRTKLDWTKYLVAFLFLTLSLYFIQSWFTLFRKSRRTKESNYFKSNITSAMMFALIMTLITLAGVSVFFVYKSNNSNQHSMMASRINTMQTILQARCRYANDYTALNNQETSNMIEEISNSLKSDITLYTTSGKEFRSTTPEVFERLLIGTRMNQDAFENIMHKHRRYYINTETVGGRKTHFLYAPLINSQNNIIAIMASPYTDNNVDFMTDAVLHSVTIITVFLILLLLARFIAIGAVDKMFKPLSEMGKKMNETNIHNLEYITYNRNDEIASLVKAYNMMVHELYNSTEQLTQAERDKAWATMARQVAHEIKNPLTPIKLQIQRLINMKARGNDAWMDKFDEISVEILKQIDVLADTANEFSTFAKLYTEEPVEINLDELIKEQIVLFDSGNGITFSYMGLENTVVLGPKPQLTRLIVNLICNSIQAIEDARNKALDNGEEPVEGHILISLRRSSTKDGYYDIVFEDNGPGVSEENQSRLFTPNFTTKSNGTGLGLSICRSILEKCNGDISYSRSFNLKGACFTVRYPGK